MTLCLHLPTCNHIGKGVPSDQSRKRGEVAGLSRCGGLFHSASGFPLPPENETTGLFEVSTTCGDCVSVCDDGESSIIGEATRVKHESRTMK